MYKKTRKKTVETFLLYYTATYHPFSRTREASSKEFLFFSGGEKHNSLLPYGVTFYFS